MPLPMSASATERSSCRGNDDPEPDRVDHTWRRQAGPIRGDRTLCFCGADRLPAMRDLAEREHPPCRSSHRRSRRHANLYWHHGALVMSGAGVAGARMLTMVLLRCRVLPRGDDRASLEPEVAEQPLDGPLPALPSVDRSPASASSWSRSLRSAGVANASANRTSRKYAVAPALIRVACIRSRSRKISIRRAATSTSPSPSSVIRKTRSPSRCALSIALALRASAVPTGGRSPRVSASSRVVATRVASLT